MEKHKLPNATAVLVLGILSLVSCCCYGIFGLVFAVIALILAQRDLALYRENPELYSNYDQLNIGRILSLIGLALSIIFILMIAYKLYEVGWEGLQEMSDEFMRAYDQERSR